MVHLSFRVTLLLLAAGLTSAVNCPPTDKAGSALESATTNGNVAACTYPTARLCQYFSDGSFSSGSSQCPVGLPQTGNSGASSASSSSASSSTTTTTQATQTQATTTTGSTSPIIVPPTSTSLSTSTSTSSTAVETTSSATTDAVSTASSTSTTDSVTDTTTSTSTTQSTTDLASSSSASSSNAVATGFVTTVVTVLPTAQSSSPPVQNIGGSSGAASLHSNTVLMLTGIMLVFGLL